MRAKNRSSLLEHYGWLLLILLAAAFLRLYNLSAVPPGLTHDEADHGLTAWSIVSEGLRQIYFTIGYGREPLYDYVTAFLMTFLGPTYLAGRIIAAYSSILLIAAMVAWVRHAFDRPTALLTAAGLAVGFWPLMSGRQALRSSLLPTLFVLAVTLFWLGFKNLRDRKLPSGEGRPTHLLPFVAAGILLGLTIYTYIPARGLWIIFPALLLYLLFVNRSLFRKILWPTALLLLIMLLVAAPLLAFLATNPDSEVRIQQLAAPLSTAVSGDYALLSENIEQGLALFFLQGDSAWRYNIAGKPLLGPLTAFLFLAGLVIATGYAIFQRATTEKPGYGPPSFLALVWLAIGILPVMITGSFLAMTQAIGLQPVLYLFPAIALVWAGQIKIGGQPLALNRWAPAAVLLFFAATAALTYRDYFVTWANHPEVRVQYESTLSAAIDYLNEQGPGAAALSTITPHRYHSPAVAQMRLRNEALELHWFDARSSLIIPDQQNEGQLLIPGFTPLAPALEGYLATAELQETLPLRETDLDRPLSIYALDGSAMLSAWRAQLTPVEAHFDDVITLQGYHMQPNPINPGETLQLVTMWQAGRPLTDAVLFTHVLGQEGPPLAQQDRLGVPGASWQNDTWFLQLFEIEIPSDTAAGQYPITVGVYTQPDGQRLSLAGATDEADLYHLADLIITP